jgi:exopolysaccharide biosynthesis polyprenyl glycosylphosphotransferase
MRNAPRVDIMTNMTAKQNVANGEEVRTWTKVSSPSLAASERRLLLWTGDVCLIAILGRVLASIHSGPGSFLALTAPTAVAWLVVGQFSDLYDINTAARARKILVAIARTGAAVTALLLLLFYVHPYVISRSNVLTLALAAPAVIALWRIVYIRLFGAVRFQRRVLIVGAGAACRALLKEIHNNHGHGVFVVGLVDDDPGKQGTDVEGVPVLRDCSAISHLVTSLDIEEVVLSISRPASEAVLEGIGACYERGVNIGLMPHLYEEVAGRVPVDHMGRGWLGAVPLSRTGGSLHATIKRAVDIVVSIVALVLTLPLMAVIAVLVRASSPGPVLFRQTRFGLHGHPFDVIKFRTMTVDAGQILRDPADRERVTRIGRLLRRMHLDEIPQLFLILRGDMSLVGPRPKRADEARELEQTIPLYRVRYRMRPGLTGWAQIRYRYAANPDDEMAKLCYDLYYVKHHSLLLDLTIIVRTAAHVLGMRGF